MSKPVSPPRALARRFARVRLVLSACALLGVGAVGTDAAFLDSAAISSAINTGTISMAVSGPGGYATAEHVAPSSHVDALVPGGPGVLTRLVVHNTGSLPLEVTTVNLAVLAAPDIADAPGRPVTTLNELLHLSSSVHPVAENAAVDCDSTTERGSAEAFTAAGATPQWGPIIPKASLQLCLRIYVPVGVMTPAVVNVEDAASLSIRFDVEQAATTAVAAPAPMAATSKTGAGS